MRPRTLPPLLVLAATLFASPASAGTCQRLLVDPAGDATTFGPGVPYPTAIDDPAQVDVRWAELSTTRTSLVATIMLRDLQPEGPRTLAHAYSMTFTVDHRNIQLIAFFDEEGKGRARAEESAAGAAYPDDGGAYIGFHLGDIKASRDLRRDRVVLTVDRALLGGVGGTVTGIGATGWAAVQEPEGELLYGVADRALTKRSYRPGAAACLR